MTTTTKVLLGIVGAAAAGVVIGMLVAPDKGSELRKKIKSNCGDWANTLGDLFNAGKEKAEDLAAEAGNKYNRVKENLG
ncbi:YtxH domain-containing protein [Paraflavitalea sp. CAU 1676]|uniref:YtxH domain-containing protein n=1 Tax=Paraflavitalea sp. CAU 1676 TaxID=3032598 RepID=UPI0023DAACA3|nr:YtxH domain-containing protein [Paraflavitalea sp. CAU 1676]MDF2190276.1 YtxH domain-containing protein [Paraflavitalea sp. CAU 1676]